MICYGQGSRKQPLIGEIYLIGELLTVIKYEGSISGPWKPKTNSNGKVIMESVEADLVYTKLTVTLTKSKYLKAGCKKSLQILMSKIK